jgi:hypothetical protein
VGAGSTYKPGSVSNAALGGRRGPFSLEFLGPKNHPVKPGRGRFGAGCKRVAGFIRLYLVNQAILFDEILLFDN